MLHTPSVTRRHCTADSRRPSDLYWASGDSYTSPFEIGNWGVIVVSLFNITMRFDGTTGSVPPRGAGRRRRTAVSFAAHVGRRLSTHKFVEAHYWTRRHPAAARPRRTAARTNVG
ncbi:hypothetical protein EVAR_41915_1 [Eumeta japonica]|uniref:Uncharacterized protein n=1 Tax=Eumeta variegata TaxID=151549 RepID=A0A4C1XM23_EUMVA|nr:hypothetical protein EVAR_41915_1 [Eumeta japonica]